MARNRVATNNLFGWQATMRLNGPTGTTTAASNSNTAAAVAMMFNGSAGAGTGFSFACASLYLGRRRIDTGLSAVTEAESVCISKSSPKLSVTMISLSYKQKWEEVSKAGHSSELFLFAKKLASSAP